MLVGVSLLSFLGCKGTKFTGTIMLVANMSFLGCKGTNFAGMIILWEIYGYDQPFIEPKDES